MIRFILAIMFCIVIGCTDTSSITVEGLTQIMAKGNLTLLDVRTTQEYVSGHIPGAICIPLDVLTTRFNELDPERLIIVYCKSGCNRSLKACRILKANGFKQVKNMNGGIDSWLSMGGKTEGKGNQVETKTCPAWIPGKGCED